MPVGCTNKVTIDQIATDVEILEDHNHGVGKVAPSKAPGKAVTSGGSAWADGSPSSVILTATGLTYDVHHLDIDTISSNGTYELDLVHSSLGVVTTISFTRTGTTSDSYMRMQCMTPIMTSGTITAVLRDSVGSKSCNVKIGYHTY